jgi:hypothetical protein
MTTPLAIFTARCEARAKLWQAGELTLHEAVDTLEAYGRKLRINTDVAQDIMSRAFAAITSWEDPSGTVEVPWDDPYESPWNHPDWAEAAEEFRKDRPPVDPRIRGTFEQMCNIADMLAKAKRRD